MKGKYPKGMSGGGKQPKGYKNGGKSIEQGVQQHKEYVKTNFGGGGNTKMTNEKPMENQGFLGGRFIRRKVQGLAGGKKTPKGMSNGGKMPKGMAKGGKS